MKNQLEILAEAIDVLADDQDVAKRAGIMDDIAWEVNKYLTPTSLRLIDTEQIRHLFYSLVESYVQSIDGKAAISDTAERVDRLRNQPIGGRWV